MSDEPRCLGCGSEFKQGGAHLGPGFQFTNYKCSGQCGYFASLVGREGYYTFLTYMEMEGDAAMDYANGTLSLMARVYQQTWQAIKRGREDAGQRAILKMFRLDPDKGCQWDYLRDDKGEILEHQEEDENGEPKFYSTSGRPVMRATEIYRDDDKEILDVDHEFLRKCLHEMYDKHNKFPGSFCEPPLPPTKGLDQRVKVYLLQDGVYELVDRKVTDKLEVPPDPRRVAHDAFYTEVFDAVRKATGQRFIPTETKNGYYEDSGNTEPWYTWQMMGVNDKVVTFLFGPRKRVDSLTLSADESTLDTAALKFLGKRDAVTYDADGSWKSDQETAKEITIHSWGKDKAIEYLTAAIHLTLGTAFVLSGEGEEGVLEWQEGAK